MFNFENLISKNLISTLRLFSKYKTRTENLSRCEFNLEEHPNVICSFFSCRRPSQCYDFLKHVSHFSFGFYLKNFGCTILTIKLMDFLCLVN